jgi:hypothetical protein
VVQRVSLAIHLHIDCAVVHEELVFFLEGWKSPFNDTGVFGVFDVHTDHLREKLRDIVLARIRRIASEAIEYSQEAGCGSGSIVLRHWA